MNIQNHYGDPKLGFGETNDSKDRKKMEESQLREKEEELELKKKERKEAVEDTSSVNYGNIGVEGGVEDLDEIP